MTRADRDSVLVHLHGDVALNGLLCDPRHNATLAHSLRSIVHSVAPCDLRIANLETPLWGDGGVHPDKSPAIFTTEQAARSLLALDLDVAVLANNHVYDCLEQGVENTLRFLGDHGVLPLGAAPSVEQARAPRIVERNGLRIGLLAYVDPSTKPRVPPNAGAAINELEEGRMLAEISALREQVDAVVVNVHWGRELVRHPPVTVRRLARRAVEAGAAVVAGHHPHCLQGHERWHDGHIFYSLGNFVFAGLPGRECRQWPKLSRRTAVARCRLSAAGIESAELIPLIQEGFTLRADDTASRRRRQEALNRKLALPEASYRRVVVRETWLQWGLVSPIRFVATSGGPLRALRRLRVQHLELAWKILSGASREDDR